MREYILERIMDVRQAGAATPKGQLLAREVLVQPEDFTADQDQRTRTFNPNYDHDLVPTENYILNDLENYMVHGSAYGRKLRKTYPTPLRRTHDPRLI